MSKISVFIPGLLYDTFSKRLKLKLITSLSISESITYGSYKVYSNSATTHKQHSTHRQIMPTRPCNKEIYKGINDSIIIC